MDTPSDDNERTVIRSAANQSGGSIGALPVGSGLGEFVVVRVIGEGGFGIVYEAIDRTLQRHVAVKEFMPASLAARNADGQVSVRSERHRETFDTALRSFVNEARLLAHFDHPALVKVHRFWEANGTAYMVMPLYEGLTLQETLRNAASAPSEGLLMALLGPLTEALLVLHEQQCFHRDIAPDNILLLAGSGAPLLLDFGAARRVIGDMTQALTVILKPGYAPIEQYAETAALKQGPWTDVYALAAVVYFAITRRTPPPAVNRLVDDQYEPAARVAAGRYSAALLDAVDRALAVQPAARTQSIEDFRAQLGFAHRTAQHDSGWSQFADSTSAAVGDAPPLSMPPLVATRAAPPPQVDRSRRMWWAAGFAGLAAAGAGGAWLFRDRTPIAAPAPTTAPAPTAAAPAAAASAVEVPAPPAAPTPAAALDPFERLLLHRSPGFDVSTAVAQRRLRIDKEEQLRFSITSTRSGFVYLLLREPDGALLLMFPNALSRRNQISAGKPLTLPQSQWPLKALDPPGVQRFLVVVTQHPHDFAPLKIAQRGDFIQLDGDLRSANAAPGSALPGRAACDGAACNAYGAAAFEVENVR